MNTLEWRKLIETEMQRDQQLLDHIQATVRDLEGLALRLTRAIERGKRQLEERGLLYDD